MVTVAARVIPAARWMAICCEAGLTIGATSSAALKGESLARVSFDSPTAPTSHKPSEVTVATRPGVTHVPAGACVAPDEVAGIPLAGPA